MEVDELEDNLADRALPRRREGNPGVGSTLAVQRDEVAIFGDKNTILGQVSRVFELSTIESAYKMNLLRSSSCMTSSKRACT